VLLRIGNTATSWATIDPWVGALGVLSFLAAATLVWSPAHPHQLRFPRPLRPATRLAIQLTVFAALLPSVLPYDHLLPTTAAAATDNQSVHTAHCHGSPGTCSDAPVSSGAGQFLAAEPLIVTPALVVMLLLFTTPLLRGVTTRPEVRPPLRARIA
jgi:hypothetical protein